jgi:biopolymer transport protein ExbB/TolQ
MNLAYQIFLYYAESGGIINVLLFGVCFVVVYLGTGKALQIRRNQRAAQQWRAAMNGPSASIPPVDTVYGAMAQAGLGAFGRKGLLSRSQSRNTFREILLKHVPDFEAGFDTIAVCVAAAPLLGLLGTVAGMMKTFRIIMEFGIGNPGLLSQGISMALVTTQAGLVVAFPCLLFHNYLNNRKEDLIKQVLADGEWIISSAHGDKSNV